MIGVRLDPVNGYVNFETPAVCRPHSGGTPQWLSPTEHEPHGRHQSKKAAASAWIGSALEYYDFFIYATAASLIFPQLFFPSGNPTVAIVASLATYGVGYVSRPIGAFFLGHWGDTYGRKYVLILCMFLMGFSTIAVGLLPTYEQVGILAPILLVICRLVQGFAVAGEIAGASSMTLEHAPFGRRGFFTSFTLQGVQAGQIMAAAVFLPLAAFMPAEQFNSWGWRIPFLLSIVVIIAGYIIRKEVDETPAFAEEGARRGSEGADHRSHHDRLARHAAGHLHGPDERHPGDRHDFRRGLRGSAGLRHRVLEGHLSCGFPSWATSWRCSSSPLSATCRTRSAAGPASSSARSVRGCSSFGYLYAISIKSVPLAIVMSLLMWGVVYQGYNAVFSAFYPELFQTRIRVSAMAISQNLGTAHHGHASGALRRRGAPRLAKHSAHGRGDRLRASR